MYSCIYFFATTFMLKRIKHSNFFLIAAKIKSQDQIFWRNTRKILALCKWYDFFQRTGTRWRSVRRRANGDVGEYQIVYVNFTTAGQNLPYYERCRRLQSIPRKNFRLPVSLQLPLSGFDQQTPEMNPLPNPAIQILLVTLRRCVYHRSRH